MTESEEGKKMEEARLHLLNAISADSSSNHVVAFSEFMAARALLGQVGVRLFERSSAQLADLSFCGR